MRGTAWRHCEPVGNWRITPACAGNRADAQNPQLHQGDHPRVCGEQRIYDCSCLGCFGSPPRVRGTGTAMSMTREEARITPACAGNSCCHAPAFLRREDHPRVCGEQYLFSRTIFDLLGSPPRVRGTVNQFFRGDEEVRITPACAGNRPRLFV